MNASRGNTQSVFELLNWYREIGVDEAHCAAPVDRFKQSAAAERPNAPARREHAISRAEDTVQTAVAQKPAVRPSARLDIEGQALDARARASACQTLEELRAVMAEFDGLSLKKTAKNLVFGDGNPKARVMFIGEAPGREEDLRGVPFVGRSGQLLDRMMAAIELDRTSAYITNVIAWRPPGNRTPSPAETAVCRPFIERHIELVSPQVLVFLGGVAAKEMLKVTTGIMRLRGQWLTYPEAPEKYRVMATLHPAYLLRQPAHKRLAWRDFLEIRRALEAARPDNA